MAITISMKRAELIQHLEKQLELAKVEDAKAKESHEAEEQAALVKFKEKCRAALDWDYETAKKVWYTHLGIALDRLTCPRLKSTEIENVIKAVKLDTRTAPFRVGPGTDLHRSVMWVPDSQRLPETACD